MNPGRHNAPTDNPDPVLLPRYMRGWNTALSIVVFAVLSRVRLHTDFKELGMWLAGVLAGGIPLVYGFVPEKQQKAIKWLLVPWFALGLVFVIVAVVDTRARDLRKELRVVRDVAEQDLKDARLTAARYRDAFEKKVEVPFTGGQPWMVHQFLLAPPRVHRVRILGINALGVLHSHRANLQQLIHEGGSVQILLLKGKHGTQEPSDAFNVRVRGEEKVKREGQTWIAGRIQAEWEASIAILRDILNHLLETHRIEDLQQRFQIRFHKETPDRSMLFVDKNEEDKVTGKLIAKKYLLMNRYSDSPKEIGQRSLSLLVNEEWVEYHDDQKRFKDIWCGAEEFLLEKLKKKIVPLHGVDQTENHNLEAPTPDQLNSRALRYHEQRRLDDASCLYREVLKRREPKRPTQKQKQLAERFLPRLYVTEKEPFQLKDLVVVLHPTRRLIGYHLVWEDDIDFLIDNDPGDHEIVWIQYDEAQELVEHVWAYWHGNFLQTKEAVEDANMHDSAVKVFVQWGKHGSLLKGWRKQIKINGDKGVEEYEPLQYNRLSRKSSTRLADGRHPAKGYYAEQYPSEFVGPENAFIAFTKEIDLKERLRKRPMIVVSEFANAVIDQWFLPYNIYPKPDWPTD